MELLIFRVRHVFSENSCEGAFLVGTLKSKNIDGSEVTKPSDDSDDDSDAERWVHRILLA